MSLLWRPMETHGEEAPADQAARFQVDLTIEELATWQITRLLSGKTLNSMGHGFSTLFFIRELCISCSKKWCLQSQFENQALSL